MIDCEHWQEGGICNGGICNAGKFGGRPSYGTCRACLNGAESRGLGDTIAKITTRIGIKPCGGCKKRRRKLNELVPYRR